MARTTAAAPAGAMNVTRAATFIPEIWSDDILVGYKKRLVVSNLMRKMSFVGKKGDTIHLPSPRRGAAQAKVANTRLSVDYATESEIQILIDKHYARAVQVEDIVEKQALASLRRFYTDDISYSMAVQIDTDAVQLGREANNGAGTAAYATAYIGGDGSTAYVAGSNNETAITDPGLRRMIQRLDDNDVPMDERFLVIPPSSKNSMLGIARFTEQAFRGEGEALKNGMFGQVYGLESYVTTNCDTTSGSNSARVALIGHPDAWVMVEQQGVRVQSDYELLELSTVMVADTIYGLKMVRDGADAEVPAALFAIAVPA